MTKIHKLLIIAYLIIMITCLFYQSRTGIDYDYLLQQNVYYIEFYYVRIYSMIMFIATTLFLFHWGLLFAAISIKKQTEFEHHILKH